ncbi:hypothetical protein [uncultured Clostridium sp.]|uniref:hypothetical protein n=1 Tax=uncultured Clostridium sp. TaxID=59620 RepID=UPI00262F43A1|nr:hypothetical protein [uncultured Clostridium sp.]
MKINDYKTEELVKILNKGLAKGKSGVAICKEIGLARSSVLTRIKRDGYIHDKEQNIYVKETGEEVVVKKEEKKKTAAKKNDSKKDTKKDTKKAVKKKEKNKDEIITEKNTDKETKKKEIERIDALSVDKEEKVEENNVEISISAIDIDGQNTEIEENYEGEWKVEEAIAKLRKELENKKKKEKGTDNKAEKEIKIEEKLPIIEKIDEKATEKEIKKVDEKASRKEVEKNVAIIEEKSEEVISANEIQLDEFENLKMMIKALDKRLEMVEKQKGRADEKTVSIKNTKETTTRSIRLYKEVNDKLNKYLKKNKEKKVIDIISLAILEYVEK